MINIIGNSLDYWKDSGIENKEQFLCVNSSGYQKFLTKNFSIIRKNGRLDYQLIYITKGKGYFTFNDNEVIVNEGNVVIFLPNEPQIYNYHSLDNTELYWIHFTGCNCSEYLSKFELTEKRIFPMGNVNDCEDLLKKIIHELQIKKDFFNYLTSSYLLQLLILISRYNSEKGHNNKYIKDNDIKKIIELMHLQYNQNHLIKQYAKECNLSLYRFIHKFKEVTGMTPLNYITKIRINIGKDLLSNSLFNISEVASLIGYEDPLYFSRVFKKETGLCPTDYRFKSI